MKTFTVVSNLSHNNKDYAPGRRIDLEDEFSDPLVAVGVIKEGYEGTEKAPANTANTANTGPTDPTERLDAIKAAINTLNIDNGDLWLRDGKPNVAAIVDVTGWNLTAAERDAAWVEVKPA